MNYSSYKLSDRLGGHLVTGHIDGTGEIKSYSTQGEFVEINFTAHENILKYIIEKGSVAIDGISLTVSTVRQKSFTVDIIPFSFTKTNISSSWKTGKLVNIEIDITLKQIQNSLKQSEKR